MKRFNLSFLALIILFAAACEKSEGPEESVALLAPVAKKIEKFDSAGAVTCAYNYEFEYRNEGDYFWEKAVKKDGDGKVLQTIERTLDDKGFPVKAVYKDENGKVNKSIETKYCPSCYGLLEETVYDGEISDFTKISFTKYMHVDGKLVSKTVQKFSCQRDYKNAEGTKVVSNVVYKYLPSKENYPEGNYDMLEIVESAQIYYAACCPDGCDDDCGGDGKEGDKDSKDDGKDSKEGGKDSKDGCKDSKDGCKDSKDGCKDDCKDKAKDGAKEIKDGALIKTYKTEFNDEGYPVKFTMKSHTCGTEINLWYKIEKDGFDNLSSLATYYNEALDSLGPMSKRVEFAYGDTLMIEGYTAKNYNSETGQFDIISESVSYEWRSPGFVGGYNIMRPSVVEEEYCPVSKKYEYEKMQIETYTEEEMILLIYEDSRCGAETKPEPDPKLKKRKIVKFKKVMKK